MEDAEIESHENEIVSRTSRLLRLYKHRTYLQQKLQQLEVKVKSLCGMCLSFLSVCVVRRAFHRNCSSVF